MPKSRLYRVFVLPALLACFQTIAAQVPAQPAQIADRMGISESAMQLSATLPRGIRPGGALMQALDGNGVETQGQYAVFQCVACPAITEIIDSDKQLGEFHPGTVVTITGANFSPSGNTVIVEQQDVTTRRYRFTAAAADVLEQSPARIKVKLPNDLIATKFVVVVVANKDGLESNMYALRPYPFTGITPECPSCPPAIGIKNGIVTRDGGTENFLPASVVTIRGDRFSPSGNTVIVEQGSHRTVVEKDSGWSESMTRIDETLPAALLSGRAVIYVVNARGQESKAQAIAIARSAPIIRRPIRRGDGRKIQ